ncbi:TMEM175 family protein [Amycolatopsis sp. H20-H5]|uniref:TMEM175 family protein n=1 Tax=Amycolatopsis sp. H20-H5 TaxID=3046309 RepID=UPI002DB5618F|nr:TMEM175 family protein [Amycolatopsis sp. H20-H5]MEC3979770.1 TMEM175 family protein [Amycolatopsis sp. H20-H5]
MTISAPDETPGALEVRAVAAERLTFFGDAVIAIALTLLALELPLPEGATNGELLHSALEHRWEYIAFLVSFLVIGAHWSGHHRVFRYVTSLGGKLGTLTLY